MLPELDLLHSNMIKPNNNSKTVWFLLLGTTYFLSSLRLLWKVKREKCELLVESWTLMCRSKCWWLFFYFVDKNYQNFQYDKNLFEKLQTNKPEFNPRTSKERGGGGGGGGGLDLKFEAFKQSKWNFQYL